MADIDVVKKGSRAWVWILVALALVLLIWFLMMGADDTTRQIGLLQIIEGGQPHVAAALRLSGTA